MAYADSAVGVDTALGNALNPPGRSAMPRPLASDGFDTVRHSPSGQLYGIPLDRSDENGNSTDSGWEYSGGADVGVLGGDAGKKSALFRKYKDLKNGPYLDYFEVEGDKKDSAAYAQAFGGGTGRHDQFYGMQFGVYNDWRVKLFYNETQHVFTDTYKSIYNGTGSGNLTLAGGLKPNGGAVPVVPAAGGATVTLAARATQLGVAAGNVVGAGNCTPAAPCWLYNGKLYGNAAALAGINWTGSAAAAPAAISANSIAGSINNYLKNVDDSELSIVRKKGGVMAELKLTNEWKGYVNLNQEKRTGSRPFGMTENNYNVEIPEPIDYTTIDFLAGISYADSVNQFNLRASGSFFHNAISDLTVQQPWLSTNTALGGIQTAKFDLNPDNKAFNFKGEYGRNLEVMRGRFTANAAWGTSRQDDQLQLPVDPTQTAQFAAAMLAGGSTTPYIFPTVANPGYLQTANIDLRNWDGTNGWPLSQRTAKQRIDTKTFGLGLVLNPSEDLSVKGDIRYFATSNKGGYIAYNPLTAQFGRGFIRSTSFDLAVGSAGVPGAIGQPCYTLPGFPVVPGCTFNGVLQTGVAPNLTSANNPSNVPVFANPREQKQLNYSLGADYDLGNAGSVNAALEREEFRRTYRERDRTWENKLKFGYVNRGYELATLRVSYETDRKRGSAYNFWPVGDFATGLPGLDWNTMLTQYLKAVAPGWNVAPANMAGFFANRYNINSRKYDEADRNQQILNTRLNVMPRSDMDIGISLQRKDATYPNSGYGLENDRMTSINLDANYQPSNDQQLYTYYSHQNASKAMRASSGFNAAGAAPTCTATAGAVLTVDQFVAQCAAAFWLPSAAWDMDTRDKNDLFGLGFQTSLGDMGFSLDYTYSVGRTDINYRYGQNTAAAAAVPQLGTAFPNMALVQNTLTAHLVVPIEKKVSAPLMYRHESGKVKDWHYDNIPIGASAAENQATLLLDAGAQNYHTNVFGVFFQFKL